MLKIILLPSVLIFLLAEFCLGKKIIPSPDNINKYDEYNKCYLITIDNPKSLKVPCKEINKIYVEAYPNKTRNTIFFFGLIILGLFIPIFIYPPIN